MVQTSEMRAGISPPLAGSESARAWLGSGLADLQSGRARFALGFDDAVAFFGRRLIVNVDPARLEYQLENEVNDGDRTYAVPDFFVGNGDWSPWLKSLQETRVAREARQLVQQEFRFRRTHAYRTQLERIATQKVVTLNHVLIDSQEKLDDYFRNFCQMFHRAGRMGIRVMQDRELESDESFTTGNSARPVWAEYTERNIGIAIGSRGELYRVGPGQHRTAVAKTLNLAKMPCEVRLLHVDWIERQLLHSRQPLARALRMAVVTACQATG